MKRKYIFLCIVLASLVGMSWVAAHGQAPAPAAASDSGAAAARALLDKGQYADALAMAEGALKGGATDPALKLCQVDALLGLHRTMDARQVALSNLGAGPGFRFKAGICSEKFGRISEALDLWKPLYAAKDWAEPAYRESVLALVAIGKEGDAKALLAEALQKTPGAPVSLLNLCLDLQGGSEAAKAALDKLKTAAPQDAARLDTVAKLYAAAGGETDQESLDGKPPVAISLKEKTERVEANALSWGGSGGTTPNQLGGGAGVATSSGQQGYGYGNKDTSSKEGGKTGTMSSHPRVVVDAKLNGGSSEPMVIDTATDVALVTARVAKKLGLQTLGPAEYDGIGVASPVSSSWVLLKEIKVGPLTFRNVPAMVMDEKTEYWKETGGILPLWLFRHYAMHYDRRHSKLELLPSGTPPEQVLGQGTFQTKVLWFDRNPYMETRIQDKPSCFILLGTNNVATYLEKRRLADLGVTLQTSKYGTQQARGFFGIITSGVADNVTIYLGATRINLPTVHVADLCPDTGVDCCGILGRNILDLFDVYLDYQANVLAFKGYEKGS